MDWIFEGLEALRLKMNDEYKLGMNGVTRQGMSMPRSFPEGYLYGYLKALDDVKKLVDIEYEEVNTQQIMNIFKCL